MSLEQRLRASTALQAVAMAVLLVAPRPAAAQLSPNAHPTGGQVVAGQASIGQGASTTTVNQSSQRAAVNWQSFDVGSAQSVQFQQPNASAVTLNTVVGPNPSQIAGKIQANGQLVIVNQAGLVFDKGSQINAAGLVVSAAGISTSNFMAGKMVFDQAANAGAKVENRGTITIKDAGLAALVAPRVRNAGVIQAKLGTVILAGAEAATLDLYGDGLVSINVTKQVASAPDGTKALVTNSGVIAARGGSVVLTADAVDGVVQTLVDAGGHISANSTAGHTGRVLISGAGGDVRVEGTVTAEGNQPGLAGGAVKVSGSNATIIGAHAKISVSGQAGGGTVALGTTLKRARDGATGIAAATTRTLVVNKGATIAADATAGGNGGRVVALASGSTRLAGTISAKGGPASGNGGFVELSGNTVALPGHVDASAPHGASGLLLIDPTDVWVSDTQPSGTTSGTSWFSPATLEGQNADIALGASGNLNVASSYGTGNTLLLGSHNLTLAGGTGLTIDQGFGISAGSILLTTQAGSITLNGASGVTGGLITAPQLAMLSPTAIGVAAGGTIIMTAAGGIALGAATVGSQGTPVQELDLYTSSGGITQDPAGAVFATTVRGSSVGSVGLYGSGNQIGNLPLYSVSSGDFGLVDSVPLLVSYAAANNVFLQVTGGNTLTLDNAALVTTGSSSAGRVSLVADALSVPMTATVTGGTVELSPSTPGLAVSILPTTPPPDTLTIDQELLSRLQTTTLRIGGYTDVPGNRPSVTPVSGSINIASAFNLTGIASTLDLESIGPVTQNAALTATTLTGNAGTVTLTDPGNNITNLGSFTASAFTLTDPDVVDTLHVIGPVTAPTVALSAPNIDIDSGGVISAIGSTMLTASAMGGTIAEGGVGVIDTALLTGSAGGGVTLDGANDVAQLGTFAPGGNFLLNNGTNALGIVGAFSGAGDTMTLHAGSITQSAAGIVTAGTLTGTATGVDLSTATGGNQVATLGDFAVTGGDFILTDGSPLAVNGTVGAGTIFLQVLNGNALSLASTAALNADPSTGLATLVTDQLSVQPGAAITGATVEIAPNTAGLPVSVAPATPPADTLTIDQTALAAIDTTTLRIGAFTDAPAAASGIGTPTAGSINLASAVDLTGIATTLDLQSTGPVTQSGGLTVNTLIGNAGTATLTDPGNDITNLGSFTAASFTLIDPDVVDTLHVIGAVTAPTVALSAPNIDIDSGGIITAATSSALAATGMSGTIAEGGVGVIDTGLLTGSAGGGVTLDGANDVARLGTFAPGGNFLLNNGTNALEIVGAFSGAGDTMTLTTGALTQSPAGVITAQELTGSAAGVDLSTASGGNDIATLGAFSPGGDFNLNNGANALQFVGGFSGGGDTLTLNTGAITQTAQGVITAGTLTGSASSVDLSTAANMIADIGPFTAAGGFSLNDNTGLLTVIGALSGGPAVTLVNTDGISQTAAGVITAGTLSGNAGAGAADFGAAINLVTNLGSFGATTGFTLNDDVPALTVTGPVNGGTGIAITNTGALDIDAGLTASGIVALNAAGIAQTVAGVIDAGTLTGSAGGGDAALGAATNGVSALGPFSAGGAFALLNGPGLTVVGNVTAGTDAAIAVTGAGSGLNVNAGVTIQSGTGNTLTLSTGSGNIGNAGTLIGGLLASLNAGYDLVQSGVVTADAVTETAGDSILHYGNSIATAGNATLTAGNTILQSTAGSLGTIAATGGAVTLTAYGTAQAADIAQTAGALIIDPTAGQTIGLTAATGIAYAGTIAAAPAGNLANPVGTVVFTANGGDITETQGGAHTGLVSALTLTGSATGAAALDAPSPAGTANQVVNLGPFTTGGDFTLIDGQALTVAANVAAGGNATVAVNGVGNGLTVPSGVSVTAGGNVALAANAGTLTQGGTVQGGASATLTAGANLQQNGLVQALGGGATLTAANDLTQSGTVAASASAVLAATGGSLNQNGSVTTGTDATLTAGNDLSQAGKVQATGGSASLTAGNDLTQSGTVTAGANATLTASNGTLSQSGVVTVAGAATLMAANDLRQTGTVRATGGNASLTAGADLTQSKLVQAGGNATLTASAGNVTQSGSVSAGGSAIATAKVGSITDSGTITAPNIQLAAPGGTVTVSGTLAGIVPDPSLNPTLKLKPGTFPANPAIGAWIIGGNIVLTPSIRVTGAGGGQSQLVVSLTNPQGVASLGDFKNPSTDLYLNLGLGYASGQIMVKALQVQYQQPGTAKLIDLLGTVDGYSGYTAASASFIYPRENNNYEINGCPISATNCFQIPTLVIPTINPLKDLEVSTPDQPDDILIILPDVGERDY